MILIKSDVYDYAYGPLVEAAQPAVDVRIPFPGSGRQKEFEVKFKQALEADL